MGTNASILALSVESPASRHIWVLTNWELADGKVAVVKKRTDDLTGNNVEIVFEVQDGPSQNLKILTRADLQNPVGQLDPTHQVKISVFETGVLMATDSMDTGNAHHN